MDKELKKNALSQLIQTKGDQTDQALKKELNKIATKLETENLYDELEDQLEFLKIISPRLIQEAIEVYQKFLLRLRNIELEYPDVFGISPEDQKKYRNKERLTIKVIESLDRIRYFDIEKIFGVLLEYSLSDNEEIKKAAVQGLNHLSEYNLDAIYSHDNWPGIGFYAQKIIVEKIQSLKTKPEFLRYFAVVNSICSNLLSPTMSGTSWNFKSVTLRSAETPVNDEIKKIRSDVLNLLQDTYLDYDLTIPQKLSIISTLNSANSINSHGTTDKFIEIVYENVIEVLKFFRKVIKNEKLQVMQKIEHDSYWLCYRRGQNEQICNLAFEIRDYLFSHEDYQIYRTLVGFESIFTEWETGEKDDTEYDSVDKYKKRNDEREAKVLNYAESINGDNFSEWEDRIIRYSETESSDLATFPFFAKFLEHFCKYSPELGIKLMDNHLTKLRDFLPCIFSGLWSGNKNMIRFRMEKWIAEGLYLYQIARIFEFNGDFDEELLKKLLLKAIEEKDKNVLKQLISSVAANYSSSKQYLISDFFIPAIEELNKLEEAGWIFHLWYRIERNGILSDLGDYGVKTILSNLLNLNSIDYQAEEILTVICRSAPDQVIDFFIKRLNREKDREAAIRFDAIPYEFYKLHLELSKIPEIAVNEVRESYDGNYGMFIFRGARFLKIIFPEFPKDFEQELGKLLNNDNETDMLFVLGILRNYGGKPFIHNLCKKIITILPENHRLLDEIRVALISTDGVWGEYGMLNAYQERKELVSKWLDDVESEKVRNFAQNYILDLQRQMELEKKRVDDNIEIMKYEYGEDDK